MKTVYLSLSVLLSLSTASVAKSENSKLEDHFARLGKNLFPQKGPLGHEDFLGQKLEKQFGVNFLENSLRHALPTGSKLIAVKNKISKEIETLRFQHFFEGIEVLGSQAMIHRSALSGISGQIQSELKSIQVAVQPTIQLDQAITLGRGLGSDLPLVQKPTLKILPALKQNGRAHLAYLLNYSPERGEKFGGKDLWIDAHSGELIAEIPHEYTLASSEVYSAAHAPEEHIDPISGAPIELDLTTLEHVVIQDVKQVAADETAVRALRNSQETLQYYFEQHGRNSFDDLGTQTVSVVHVGREFANAFWSSDLKLMAYGDGDGQELGDLTLGRDVAGHEMTHGVVSETANLVYMNDPGALNEGFADFFGEMIEGRDDWIMGSDLFLQQNDPARLKAIRNLKNPAQMSFKMRDSNGQVKSVPYPTKMSERIDTTGACSRSNDYCRVHTNSTIVGHLGYLLVQELGKQKAEKLMYQVLTHYLTQTSDFAALGKALRDACQLTLDLDTCSKVEAALQQVEM